MATLTSKQRKKLPLKAFALGGRRYPIEDEGHAKAALARVQEYGTPSEKARVRAAVGRRFPKMKLKKRGGAK